MMADAYASKPTLSQKQPFKMQFASNMRPNFHPKVLSLAANGPYIFGNIGRPSYGSFGEAAEAAAVEAAEAAEEAAITIQRAYRNIKSRKSSKGKGGKRKSKKRNSR
jgi:hypothetical protein